MASFANSVRYHVGEWWRCSRYVIRRGYIQPADGSEPERYDAWGYYYGEVPESAEREREAPPYESLLDLVGRLESSGATDRVTADQEGLITDWCAENGLLGVLLQQIQCVTLAARWRRPITKRASDLVAQGMTEEVTALQSTLQEHFGSRVARIAHPRKASGQSALRVVQRHHNRTFDGRWITTDTELLGLHRALPSGRHGRPIPCELVSNAYQPRVGFLDRFIGEWRERPLSDRTAWTDYFPSIPQSKRETYDYPSPATPAFWKLYSEPVEVFLRAAVSVANAIRAAMPPPRARKRRTEADTRAFAQGLAVLNGLLGATSPAVYRTESGALQQRWVAPSLLASFAMMALQDATGHVVGLCEFCGLPFQKASLRARFCSDACRDAARKVRGRKTR